MKDILLLLLLTVDNKGLAGVCHFSITKLTNQSVL